MTTHHIRLVASAVAAALIAAAAPAHAALYFFQPTNGDWEVPANWNTIVTGGGTSAQPGTADDTTVRAGDTANFTATSGDHEVRTVGIGGANTTGTLNVSGDDTLTANLTGAGTSGLAFGNGTGTGILNQTGATIDVLGNVSMAFNGNAGATSNVANATYNHSAGTLLVGGDMRMSILNVAATNKSLTSTYNISGTALADIDGTLFVGQSGLAATNFARGTLTIAGSNASIETDGLTLATGSVSGTLDSRLRYTMDAVGVTDINVDGAVSLGGELQIDLSALNDPYIGDILLIDNDLADAIIGTFGALTGLGGTSVLGNVFSFGTNSFTLSYTGGDGNDLVLVNDNVSVIPTPASAALAAVGLTMILARRSRRRN